MEKTDNEKLEDHKKLEDLSKKYNINIKTVLYIQLTLNNFERTEEVLKLSARNNISIYSLIKPIQYGQWIKAEKKLRKIITKNRIKYLVTRTIFFIIMILLSFIWYYFINTVMD